MAVVIVVETVIGLALFSTRAGLGILLGGVMAFANYYWQRHSLKAIFDMAVEGTQARFLALRYILRYIVIGAVLGLIYLTGTVSIVGVIFGLASFSIAVVVEGFTNIFASSYKREV
jgi:hypothetical protein